MSIAGFDPSGGAGVIADVKTFEAHRLQGFSVITANTIQTEDEFVSVNWIDEDLVFEQLETLLRRYKFSAVKIGLVPSASFLLKSLNSIFEIQDSEFKIRPSVVWDPVLSASAGVGFNQCLQDFTQVLKSIDYITPNWKEIQQLTEEDAKSGAKTLSQFTKVYLKGGHSEELGKDYLFTTENEFPFKMKKEGSEKHGSGCMFSSALAANLALEYPEVKACLRSKRFIEARLSSNPTKLASF